MAVVLLIGNWSVAQQKKNVRQEQKAFFKALNYAESDDYEKAISAFSNLVKTSPTFTEAYLHLGLCYLNTNKGAESAIPALQTGLSQLSADDQATPLGHDFMMALGEAYQVSLKPDSAILVYNVLLTKVDNADLDFKAQIEQEINNCRNAKVFLANPVQLTITNLGEAVNSRYDDHSPLVNVYEDVLLFTSRRPEAKLPELADGQFPEKVYVSANEKAHWEKAKLLNVFFKNPVHESGVSLSPDGNSLFIYRSDNDGKSIYVSYLEKGEWTEPVKLPYPINTPADETHASLSGDRSTLFFTSDREGGYGGLDIYMCKKDAYGRWGEARNLGSSINTRFDEETSMIHADGRTLYFASEGHNSMGRLDVFYAQMNSDSTWSLPVNLGYPINTPDDDFFFLPSLDKSHAYYASSRFDDNYGGSDIYKVEFDAAFEGELAVIEGQVSSADMKRGPIRLMVTRMTDRQLVGDYRPDEQSGKYTMFLETGHEYSIEQMAINQPMGESVITVEPEMAYQKEPKVYSFSEIQMTPPLKRVIVAKTLSEQNIAAVAAIEADIKHIEYTPYFTLQVLALKRRPLFASLYLKGLDVDDIRTIKCKDGYTRYLYGAYIDYPTAKRTQKRIQQSGKFDDSFVRRLSEVEALQLK
ncbi:PD40 domain-containing protein [Carboxylicivirga sediminis]|uniref:PD40 domain-containing protein n=1 Tax=Carboxylicivirga sediminis TaxID=2006564 RepID=A0A941IXH4_9BACT|nr:PD40 domain-containing protein [Carboxylicivirga sediminis]MBR8535603.1 PD40 domain-containing protein [Carboxylicivirga sediminis]